MRRTERRNKASNLLTAVVANRDGEIFDLEGFAAVGMAGPLFVPLARENTLDMPFGGELMLLPDRRPVLYSIETGRFEIAEENPQVPGERILPVAAFNSPGYMVSYTSAYDEEAGAAWLPLFSYGAVGWGKSGFRSAVIRVDRERRQDLRLMRQEDVIAGAGRMRKQMPDNRLRAHLERCALDYGCPAGKNFFLGRYEAPLPTARSCNARCLGCLSYQSNSEITPCQERIDFTPSPEEIAEVALAHIMKVDSAIVSFGQGCEGDPITEARTIEAAIRMIRAATRRGTINMNTNGSRPRVLKGLFEAGLDSVRISINSLREACYNAYFRPLGYGFADVMASIDLAADMAKFVSINYLNCPGFTDAPQEVEALTTFLKTHKINQIQWRNLNFDPLRYMELMNRVSDNGRPLGVAALLERLKRSFPSLGHGYFNPPRERWSH